jgi:hypothetical protein
MTRTQFRGIALSLVAVFSIGTSSAFAQDAAAVCDGLTIVSLAPSKAKSAIDGELTTFSFDMTAVVENAGDAALSPAAPLAVTLASGEEVLATQDVTTLAPGEQVTLVTKTSKWSPYTNYGFAVSIGSGEADGCTLGLDGSQLEQMLRGQ